jgi:hypothetical protein
LAEEVFRTLAFVFEQLSLFAVAAVRSASTPPISCRMGVFTSINPLHSQPGSCSNLPPEINIPTDLYPAEQGPAALFVCAVTRQVRITFRSVFVRLRATPFGFPLLSDQRRSIPGNNIDVRLLLPSLNKK